MTPTRNNVVAHPRRGWRRAMLALSVALLAALTGACGSGPGGAGSGGAAPTGGKADTAQAQRILRSASTRPTTIQITQPVGRPIPAGKSIAFVSCGLPECVLQGEVIKKATDTLGWTLTTINTDGSPRGFQNAFDTIVRQRPNGVIYNAIDESVVQNQLNELKAQGAVTGACCQLSPAGNGISYVIDTPGDSAPKGQVDAAWTVVNLGPNANVLYANIPDYKILGAIKTGMRTSLPKLCPSCTFNAIDLPLTSLGKDAPNRMVSFLRSHPKTKAVILADDAAGIGLPAALKAAGLTDVKVFGQAPYGASLQYLQDGSEAGAIVYDLYGDMFAIVDSFARTFAGVPVQQAHPPLWVLDKSNYPPGAGSNLPPIVADYQQQFAKLWGKG